MKSLAKYLFIWIFIEFVFYLILIPEPIKSFFILFIIIYGALLILNILNSSNYNHTFLDCGATTHPYQLDKQIKRDFYPMIKNKIKKTNYNTYSYVFMILLNLIAYFIVDFL